MLTTPANALKVRLGNLAGITDPDMGTLMGYGAYLNNLYARGCLLRYLAVTWP
ncbi:hypothetical protein KRR40_12705 [Niabella defluvii]|nr:hypothetical protein KRR40_12705 [Niabella sp. I65]